MKVFIGPYPNWFGPHQFVGAVFPFLSDEANDKLVDKIPSWPFEVVHKLKGERKIDVRIDGSDVWSMDETLAYIIHPMLLKLKEHKHGSPFIDNEDVPEEYRVDDTRNNHRADSDWTEADDEKFHARWEWVLDEMIWAFGQKCIDWEDQFFTEIPNETNPKRTKFKMDKEGLEKHHARMRNGFRLFGKYYEALWN
jgi:hypothetical protein